MHREREKPGHGLQRGQEPREPHKLVPSTGECNSSVKGGKERGTRGQSWVVGMEQGLGSLLWTLLVFNARGQEEVL